MESTVSRENGYPKLGAHQDDNTPIEDYAFLITDCGNRMYVEHHMGRFIIGGCICPKCWKVIDVVF